MRARTALVLGVLAFAFAAPDTASAQLSPGGVFGAVTRPFRELLGRFGHYPRHRHHQATTRERPPAAVRAEPPPQADQRRAEQRGDEQLGWVGTAAWPSAYQDILTFTFWPAQNGQAIRGRGFDLIAATVAGTPSTKPRQVATTGSATATRADACADSENVDDKWPTDRIEKTLQLTAEQRAALDQLQQATAQAIKTIKVGCRDDTAWPAPARLDAMVQQLWAVRDAGIFIRAPLKKFYDSLSDSQKANFLVQPPANDRNPDSNAAKAAMGRQYQACAGPSLQGAEALMRQFEEKLRASRTDNVNLDALRKTSSDMAKMLTAACAQPIPADPVARLDAENNQLTAINYAAMAMSDAMNGVYAQLDETQRTKLDSPGR
jgi:hypothetical protein